MPFYRIDGIKGLVHFKGSKLPAPCPHEKCLRPSAYLCDFPRGKGKTCDAPMCERHAVAVGPDRHHCPKHLLGIKEARPAGTDRASNADPSFAEASEGNHQRRSETT